MFGKSVYNEVGIIKLEMYWSSVAEKLSGIFAGLSEIVRGGMKWEKPWEQNPSRS